MSDAVRKAVEELAHYFEPVAVAEALAAITSGVLIWMGWWDLLEILLPPDWYFRLILIIIGLVGLIMTGTLYDRTMLQTVRQMKDQTGYQKNLKQQKIWLILTLILKLKLDKKKKIYDPL